MKKALLLFVMLAFIGTTYTSTASVKSIAGIYCDNCKDGHKCDDTCKKESKSSDKKSCCSKGGASASSCHGKKSGSKASASEKKKKKKREESKGK